MGRGWIKVPREAIERWGFSDRLLAFVFLVSIQDFETGEMIYAETRLKLEFGWSRKKSRHFLEQAAPLLHSFLHKMHRKIGAIEGPQQGPLRGHSEENEGPQETAPELGLRDVKGHSDENGGPQQGPLRGHNRGHILRKEKEEIKNLCARRFRKFWIAWPKKKAKVDAEKAFHSLNPDDSTLAEIIQAVTAQKGTFDWQKQGGQFIPLPATWLRGKRWEDEDVGGGQGDPLDGAV